MDPAHDLDDIEIIDQYVRCQHQTCDHNDHDDSFHYILAGFGFLFHFIFLF